MRHTLALLALLLAVAGCSTGTAPARTAAVTPSTHPAIVSPAAASAVVGSGERLPSPSAAPTQAGLPYGVLVDLFSFPDRYNVNVVSADGTVKAALRASRRTPITTPAGHTIELPYVSTSLTALYYLDGNSTVWSFSLADGSQRIVTHIAVESGQEAAFAVSPDDTRIAYTVLDFTGPDVAVTLYTDALSGGDRKVIFSSTTNYVWPVAWHAGLLVLAHAYGPYAEDIGKAAPAIDNPYAAISYHLVDPKDASRQVLMGACTVSGPLSPIGSGCIQGGTIDWTGATTDWSPTDWGTRSSAAAVSPDGFWVAATDPNIAGHMAIWRRSDGLIANYIDGPGLTDWAGWLDDQTIMVGSYSDGSWTPVVVNVIRGGEVYPINARGFYAARLPTDIV